MTKVINFELAEKLNKAGLLKAIDAEYSYFAKGYHLDKTCESLGKFNGIPYIKTLTLEEAIEFLKELKFYGNNDELQEDYYISINYDITEWLVDMSGFCNGKKTLLASETGETLLEAIEKMLEYLLDNNLLGYIKKN